MYKQLILLMAFFLLSGCTISTETQQPSSTPAAEEERDRNAAVEHQQEVAVERTETEKLALELPEEAHLNDWNLILVGPHHPLPEDFKPTLVEVDNEQRIDERIEDAWSAWKEAALQAGHRLFFASGYRSVDHQQVNFNHTYESHLINGLTEEEALKRTKEYLTEPGHSEHHTGLALDIVDEEWIVAGNGLVPEYDTQASQQWLTDTMADYGFILRYPAGKEDITNIQYESWHFRYVGEENAQFMVEHGLTLEEYIELLTIREEIEQE